MTASAIYEGTVSHRRREPVGHELRYPLFMLLLDLDELPEALDPLPLFSARRPAPIRFRARDHLAATGDAPPQTPAELADRARALAGEDKGERISGPVRLLATPRFLGVGFNPVSFLFVYDAAGGPARAVIAEVTNTPWGERHAYVARRDSGMGPIRATLAKRLHVSPFNRMDQTYELSVSEPGDSLAVSIRNEQDGRTVFGASLALRRRDLSRRRAARVLTAYPPATIASLARIYAHGLRLRLKGAPHHPKPRATPGPPRARTG